MGMFKQNTVMLSKSYTAHRRTFHMGFCRHHALRSKNRRNGKKSTGPYGNKFMFYIGMTLPEKINLNVQQLMDRSQELYEERIEVDNFAREHVKPEWHEVEDRDPYSPTPLAIRRFMWEAGHRRRYHDRRNPFVEEMLGEHMEDKYDATFRAFPEDIRAQEYVRPESYTQPTIEDLLRPRTDAEVEEWCKPADTYYTKKASFA